MGRPLGSRNKNGHHQQIIELATSGEVLTLQQIGERLGITGQAVLHALKAAGVKKPPVPHHTNYLTGPAHPQWKGGITPSERARRWVQANRDRVNEGRKRHRREHPELYKKRAASYRKRHPEAIARSQRAWIETHPEEWKALIAIGNAKRRTRFLNTIRTLTAPEWTEIKGRFGDACAYCGRDDLPLTMDHVIPLSRGGHHVKENIVPACKPCNSRKHDRMPDGKWRPTWKSQTQ